MLCTHPANACAACPGRNWGDVEINSSSLLYRVDNKALFEVPLPDVSQAQQTKVEYIAARRRARLAAE